MTKNNPKKILLGVDTVRIALTSSGFRVLDFHCFKRTANAFIFSSSGIDKALGVYLPHLHYIHRSNFSKTPTLYVECSLPKIAFGNNLQELTTDDKQLVLQNLHSALRRIGVLTSVDNLREAAISRLDLGKNLIVPNTAVALNEMNNMLPRDRKFLDDVKYENGGRGIYLRNARSGFVAYDKLSDPLLPQKFRFDRDVYSQTGLLQRCEEYDIQILRLESRFMKREHVKRLYKSYGIQNPIFEDVFCPEIAYEMINKEWKKLTSCYIPANTSQKTLLQYATDLLRDNKDVSLRNLLACLSVRQLLEENSLGQLRKLFRKHSSADTVRNVLSAANRVKYSDAEGQDVISSISKQLLEWQPLQSPFKNVFGDSLKDYNINIDEETDDK